MTDRRRAEAGLTALRAEFPQAPDQALRSATFHLYTELPEALFELLAEIAESREGSARPPDLGLIWHALYHLYNFIQIQALLPWSRIDISEEIRDSVKTIETGDTEHALSRLRELLNRVDGAVSPPDPMIGD